MRHAVRLSMVLAVLLVCAVAPSSAFAGPFELYTSSAPDAIDSSTTAEIEINSDNGDIGDLTLTCSLDDAPFASCTNTASLTSLAPGQHTFVMRATDGTQTDEIDLLWMIEDDFGAAISERPRKLSRDREPAIGWATTGDVDGVECSLDGGAWSDCLDPWDEGSTNLGPLASGPHAMSIRGFQDDGEGGRTHQANVSSYSWTVDRVAPKVTVDLPELITDPDFHVTIGVDDPDASLDCEFEGDFVDCNDLDFSGLSEEYEYQLSVEARDRAGNASYRSFYFFVQYGAPVATFTSVPPRFKLIPGTSSFAFTAPAGATIECSRGEDGWIPCTSPTVINDGFEDDWLQFAIRATKDGVTQSIPTQYRWYVGPEPFELYFDERPSPWTSDRIALFEIDADEWQVEDLTLTCSLDDGAFDPCDHEAVFTDLELGLHELRVRATSSEGGFEEIAYEWTVSDDPGVALTDTPPAVSRFTNANFYWENGNSPTGRQCNLDNAGWVACDGEWSHYVQGLSEGEHTFQVRALGDGGYEQSPPASYSWRVDLTAPVVTAGLPGGPITTSPFHVPVSANEPVQYLVCLIDLVDEPSDEDFIDCTNGIDLAGLSRGSHTLTTYAVDIAGNESTWDTHTFDWQPSTTTPTPPAVNPPVTSPAKPTLSKPGKPSGGKVRVPYVCSDSTCTLSAKVKLGKKTKKLKSLAVGKGTGKANFKLNPATKKWLKKKGKKKATLTVTITGSAGSSSSSLKF